MLLMHANNREDIKEAYAGDIVALAGLKEVRTGDTLCDAQKQVILEKMEFPDPVIEIAIEPKSKADQEKLGVALAKLVAEDPSFRVTPTRSRARPSSRGWASCISTSRSTSSSAPTRSRPISARRRSPIARRSRAPRPSTTSTRSRPAAPASSRASRSSPSRCLRAAASSSRTRSSAATCRRSTSRASRRAWSRCSARACSPASRSST